MNDIQNHDQAESLRRMAREFLETPQDEREVKALEIFQGRVGKEPVRLCCRSIKPEDDESQALMLDNKGFIESPKAKRLRMPFQPSEPEFVGLYLHGYRLAHMSIEVEGGPKVVIHYWINHATGEVASYKFKRN